MNTGYVPPGFGSAIIRGARQRNTNRKLEKRRREFRIISRLRLTVQCPNCGAPKGVECYPEYGCDNLLRAEAAIEALQR